MAPSIRAHRMAVSLFERRMFNKYGHSWKRLMLVSERDQLMSLERAVRIKTTKVYSLYRTADQERKLVDVAFSDALASIAA